MGAFTSYASTRGTAPRPAVSCQSANGSAAFRSGSIPPSATASTRTPWSAPAAAPAGGPGRSPLAPSPARARSRTGRSRRPHTPSARRIRRQISRAQLPHPVLQHRQAPLPAAPLGDNRRRLRWIRRQQLPDPRLDCMAVSSGRCNTRWVRGLRWLVAGGRVRRRRWRSASSSPG